MCKIKLNIEKGRHNGGFHCNFEFNGNHYYADICFIPGIGEECAIFNCDSKGVLRGCKEIYSKRHIDISALNLKRCIYDFLESLGYKETEEPDTDGAKPSEPELKEYQVRVSRVMCYTTTIKAKDRKEVTSKLIELTENVPADAWKPFDDNVVCAVREVKKENED